MNRMDDLISRQAAIDAVNSAFDRETLLTGFVRSIAVRAIRDMPSAQPDVPDINVGDINKFIDGLEEIFADIRERHVDDSVCGLCEYDGAYIGQSGDWCNECPGFDRDNCFKLSNECRKKWIDTIVKAQPELLTDKEQRIFLAAMGREEKVCKQVDDEWRDCREPYEDSLVRTCHEITRKVKGALWT